jgi:hypothetical protein
MSECNEKTVTECNNELEHLNVTLEYKPLIIMASRG